MIRSLARSALAHGLARTGVDRSIGRLLGAAHEPLILGYHRVLDERVAVPSRGVPSMGIRTSTLERHLAFVSRKFRFVTLDEMGARIEAGSAEGLAAVTFDDGYADFFESGFPLLQRMGIPAAIFVVTTLLERSEAFLHDRLYLALDCAFRVLPEGGLFAWLTGRGFVVTELPDQAFAATRALLHAADHRSLLEICAALEAEFGGGEGPPRSLSWEEVIRMSRAGLIVGSHTRTHSLLTHESPDRVVEETAVSRRELESRLSVKVRHFVYPDGAFDSSTIRAVRAAGYDYAYTGCRHRDADHPLLTLPRRVLWEGSTRGARSRYSEDVLSGQLNGIFDLSGRCHDDHVPAPPVRSLRAIAMVAPSLDVPGGQSIQAAALVTGLREEHREVIFVASDPRFPPVLRWLRRVPFARTLLNQALYVWSLRRLHRAEVVHIFSASFWSFLLAPVPAMLVARAFGKRVVLNYHSGEAADHLRLWGVLVHPWLRLAHEIVVPSEHLQQVFLDHGHKTIVVQNVVDTTSFAYRDRRPLRPRLLSTRALEPSYQVHIVLEAFALIQAGCPEATLVIAGSGSEEARLRRRAEKIPGVTFLGRVRPEAVPEICAAADLFVNASIVDNQPLSILEAFASGLPVVTTATGGIASMVRHEETGLIVPPADAPAMAAAVLRLLRDDGLAQRLARKARETVEDYSWPRVREQWNEVYSGSRVTVGADSLISATLGKEGRC